MTSLPASPAPLTVGHSCGCSTIDTLSAHFNIPASVVASFDDTGAGGDGGGGGGLDFLLHAVPTRASSLRNGDLVLISGRPCFVTGIRKRRSDCRKVTFMPRSLISGREAKRRVTYSATQRVLVPKISL